MADHTNANNAANETYETYDYADLSSIRAIFNAHAAITILIAIVGTALNLWFLTAMLSSFDVRSRLRNKIICNSFVLHLVSCVIIIPVNAYFEIMNILPICIFFTIIDHLSFMIELAGNWLLVMLLAVFLAQIKDFDPTSKLSSGAATLGTIGLLVFPWVASLVIVPVLTHEYRKYSSYSHFDCHYVHTDSLEVFGTIDTAVPIVLAIVLVILATFFKYRRFNLRNSSQSMQVELIGRGPEIDNTLVYVIAVVVSIVCELSRLLYTYEVYEVLLNETTQWLSAVIVTFTLSDLRNILMPIIWLLLPDVRQRIKTWRPWYRPSPGIDLTVTYTKETASVASPAMKNQESGIKMRTHRGSNITYAGQ